jgi:uncharacterized protein involved in exopolysaccharide biosynthesis/Mrp family chromosome partitioning ATPase
MEPVQQPDEYEAADSVGLLRRRVRLILAVTILGAVGAAGYGAVAPKSYSAKAVVNVNPTAADQSSLLTGNTKTAALNLSTEAQTVVSTGVATLAAKMLHSPLTLYQLTRQVTVTVPPNSSVLNIACTASTAAYSAECANDFAKAYLQNRVSVAAADVNGQLKILAPRISGLNSQIAALNTKMAGLVKNSPQRTGDAARLAADRLEVGKLIQEYSTVNGQLADTSGGSVITPATLPGKPSSLSLTVLVPSGLAVGLVLGWVVAYLVDRRDRRIHNALHAQRVIGLPVLADLPAGAFGREVSIASPRSNTGQAFTDLAHDVTTALGEGNHVVFVAGATPGPAGSVVAASLAVTLARTHSEVVLVCASMNSAVAQKLLGVGEGAGLAELIAGAATVRDVVQGPAGMPGLWVITPGADPSLASQHLQHETGRALISQLRRDARYVIIEAQVADDVADTFALGDFADAAVMVVEVGRSTKADTVECVRRLHVPVLGAALLPALGRRIAVRPPRQGLSGARLGRG